MIQEIISVIGNPIAKKRPRFARRGKFVVTYNDQETEEGRFLWEVKNQWLRTAPIEEPIELDVEFYMPIPKYLIKKWDHTPHIKKPDCSNLLKFIEDCCNQVVWRDDSQIHTLSVTKRYSQLPRTIMKITWQGRGLPPGFPGKTKGPGNQKGAS